MGCWLGCGIIQWGGFILLGNHILWGRQMEHKMVSKELQQTNMNLQIPFGLVDELTKLNMLLFMPLWTLKRGSYGAPLNGAQNYQPIPEHTFVRVIFWARFHARAKWQLCLFALFFKSPSGVNIRKMREKKNYLKISSHIISLWSSNIIK